MKQLISIYPGGRVGGDPPTPVRGVGGGVDPHYSIPQSPRYIIIYFL